MPQKALKIANKVYFDINHDDKPMGQGVMLPQHLASYLG